MKTIANIQYSLALALLGGMVGAVGAAEETQALRTLRVSTAGIGTVLNASGDIQCGNRCEAAFAKGDVLELVAVPATGWRFQRWGKGCTSARSNPVCQIKMSANRSARAYFEPVGATQSIAAGNSHSCALTTRGGVKCWGQNQLGQLGDGRGQDRLVPADVMGLGRDVASIGAGKMYNCAITTVGAVKCWGRNRYGQLGIGNRQDHFVPVDVAGLSQGVVNISAGEFHTCALTEAGGMKCWGWNISGQLGHDDTKIQLVPEDVPGLEEGVAAISVGYGHTCALTTQGGVKCWGYNRYGQVGDGSRTARHAPVDVAGLSQGVVAISTGRWHSCAVLEAGEVKCWGRNQNGQLGDGSTQDRLLPVDVGGADAPVLEDGAVAISSGDHHTCVVTSTGGVSCWGYNGFGQLGNGNTQDQLLPSAVPELDAGVGVISAGDWHTCAVKTNGRAMCWGYNEFGQLGNGTTESRWVPMPVSGF